MVRRKTQVLGLAAAGLAAGALVIWVVFGSGRSPEPTPISGDASVGTPTGSAERPALPEPRSGTGPHTLAGRIEDGAGAPIADVAVWVKPEALAPHGEGPPRGPAGEGTQPGEGTPPDPHSLIGVADESGQFRVVGLESGRYQLELTGPSVFDAVVRFIEVPGPAITVVGLRRVGITGWVSNSVADRPVISVMPDGGGEVQMVTTDERGRFEVPGLPEGRYRVSATAGSWVSASAVVDRSGTGPFADVVLTLLPGVPVDGRVEDDHGRGLAAEVSLESDEQVTRLATADDQGRFVFPAVLPGTWRASAAKPGYLSLEAVSFVAGTDYRPLVRLSRGGAVVGRVRGADGVPLAEVSVTALGRDRQGSRVEVGGAVALTAAAGVSSALAADPRFVPSGELGILLGPIPKPPIAGSTLRIAAPVAGFERISRAAEIRTEVDGTFEISGLSAGRYRVLARHPDYADGHSSEVSVVVGRDTRVDITLVRGTYVAGRVVARGGGPVVGAIVETSSADTARPGPGTVTDGDGRYRLGPVAGGVVLRARAPGYGEVERVVEVAAAGRDFEVDLTLERADAEIRGRVRDESGFAVAGATVRVRGDPIHAGFTDSYGRFSIEGLTAGDYALEVHASGYPAATLSGSTEREVEISLRLGGGVSVIVRDGHTRRPVAGATVSARGPSKPPAQVTGDDGRAELSPLVPGTYAIDVEHPGYARDNREIEVGRAHRRGELSVRDLVIEIERGATLAGTVRDRDGERVGGVVVRVGSQRVISDTRGQFRIENVRTGSVELVAERAAATGRLPLSLNPGDELVTLELVID